MSCANTGYRPSSMPAHGTNRLAAANSVGPLIGSAPPPFCHVLFAPSRRGSTMKEAQEGLAETTMLLRSASPPRGKKARSPECGKLVAVEIILDRRAPARQRWRDGRGFGRRALSWMGCDAGHDTWRV
jgi:hypothetical protein